MAQQKRSNATPRRALGVRNWGNRMDAIRLEMTGAGRLAARGRRVTALRNPGISVR
jgi:hypothetical protein